MCMVPSVSRQLLRVIDSLEILTRFDMEPNSYLQLIMVKRCKKADNAEGSMMYNREQARLELGGVPFPSMPKQDVLPSSTRDLL